MGVTLVRTPQYLYTVRHGDEVRKGVGAVSEHIWKKLQRRWYSELSTLFTFQPHRRNNSKLVMKGQSWRQGKQHLHWLENSVLVMQRSIVICKQCHLGTARARRQPCPGVFRYEQGLSRDLSTPSTRTFIRLLLLDGKRLFGCK